jgi:pimeloyl-ACP methyl ester carboxylesterase
MKRCAAFASLIITALCLVVALGVVTHAQDSALSGRWVGGFTMGGEWTALIVGFDDEGDGGYLLHLGDDRVSTVTGVRVEAAGVHFDWIAATGTLSFDGRAADGSISGEVVRGEASGFFYLARLATTTTEVYDSLIGNYQLGTASVMLVTRSDGVGQFFYLHLGQQIRLFPVAENQLMSDKGQLITFVRDERGAVSGLLVSRLYAPQLSAELYAAKVELYEEEKVHFRRGDVVLAGTLLAPSKAEARPAVVLLHGAGAAERHFYRIFADHLARQGIAALIYDKRGSGDSTGSQETATLNDYAADALAGVRFLANRQDIDPAQIGVWGISQGGRVAPMAAALSQDVAFVIGVSAPGMPPSLLDLYHNDRRYRNAGYPDRIIDMGLKYAKLLQDWHRVLARVDRLSADLTPVSSWKQVRQPVLLIYGAEDRVVPPGDSAAMITEALHRAGNRDYAAVILPEADHNLMLVTAGEKPSLAPDLMESVTRWVLERAADGAGFGKQEIVRDVGALKPTGEFGATGRYGSRPWYGGAVPQLLLMLLCGCVFLSAGVRWASDVALGRWRTGGSNTMERPTGVDSLAGAVSWLNLLLLGGFWVFVLTVVAVNDSGGVGSYWVPVPLRVLPLLAWFTAILTACLVIVTVWEWQGLRRPRSKLVYRLVTASVAAAFVWFMAYWNLLASAF